MRSRIQKNNAFGVIILDRKTLFKNWLTLFQVILKFSVDLIILWLIKIKFTLLKSQGSLNPQVHHIKLLLHYTTVAIHLVIVALNPPKKIFQVLANPSSNLYLVFIYLHMRMGVSLCICLSVSVCVYVCPCECVLCKMKEFHPAAHHITFR